MGDERSSVLAEIGKQLRRLAGTDFAKLIPEVGSNLAYAVRNPRDFRDVAAVPGRIRNAMGKPVFLKPRFGASTHVASLILEAMRYDPEMRAALNIMYSERIVGAIRGMGLDVVFVDRMSEPEDVRRKEGASMPWAMKNAYQKCGKVPRVLYHMGSVGKEPIIHILGRDPAEVAGIGIKLLGKI